MVRESINNTRQSMSAACHLEVGVEKSMSTYPSRDFTRQTKPTTSVLYVAVGSDGGGNDLGLRTGACLGAYALSMSVATRYGLEAMRNLGSFDVPR